MTTGSLSQGQHRNLQGGIEQAVASQGSKGDSESRDEPL